MTTTTLRWTGAMRITVICLLGLASGVAQEKVAQEKERPRIPDPTNLKLLKATTGPEVAQIMKAFTIGLGVQCNFCHIQGKFASEENPKKPVARKMIEMTRDLNSKFSDGKMHVTCFTCHRGEAEPKTTPEAKPAQ